MRMVRRAGGWLYDRLGLERVLNFVARHPVPQANVATRKGWMYVLGVATLTTFLLQVVTGVLLASKYIPSAASAYDSLLFINEQVLLGWFIRGMHYFGASAMVVLIFVHAIRVFLTASYKFPREMTWLFGVLLLILVMMMAATGQLLRWDQNGIWTVMLGSDLIQRTPVIGEALARFVLAGDQVGGATLSRFYSFHVLILPLLIFFVVAVHLYLVLHHGVSEPPEAGRPVDPETYRQWYRSELEKSPYRYWPDAAWREVVAALVVVAVIMGLAWGFGPKGPADPPDPTTIAADPRPDWYFRWYYALLAVKPRELETFVMVYLPLLVVLVLFLLPLVSSKGERHPWRRPWSVALVILVLAVLGALTELGLRAPWAMHFGTEPHPPEAVAEAHGPVWEGAQLFHSRGCLYCHAVAGRGGSFGPDLTDVTRRLPPEIIVTRTLNGIGDMPAYRGVLPREEMSAILSFLRSVEVR